MSTERDRYLLSGTLTTNPAPTCAFANNTGVPLVVGQAQTIAVSNEGRFLKDLLPCFDNECVIRSGEIAIFPAAVGTPLSASGICQAEVSIFK